MNDDATRTPGARLRTADVAAALAGLGAPPPPAKSWREQLLEMLREWLARRGGDETPQWLQRLLERISPRAVEMFFLVVLAGLVCALAAIVVAELRKSGWLRRKRRAKAVPDVTSVATERATAPARTFADIAALPVRARPAALLALVLCELVRRGTLPADDSLTNAELIRQLEDAAVHETALFRALARSADATVYGQIEPRAEDVEALLRDARAWAGA